MAHFFTSGLSFDRNIDNSNYDALTLLRSLQEDDDLWVLGTAAPSAPETLNLSFFSTIKARLHLICGEHGHETLVSSPIWSSVDLMKEITVDGQLIVLSYFPLMAWRGAQEDTGATQGSLHLFGNGGAAHPGWWRAVNVSLDLWDGRFATLSEIRKRSEQAFFATPWLEEIYRERRRIVRCDICHELMDRGAEGGCYRWQNGTIVTFTGQPVLIRIAEFPEWNIPSVDDEKSSFCADCLEGALLYSGLLEGIHYQFAPDIDLRVILKRRFDSLSGKVG